MTTHRSLTLASSVVGAMIVALDGTVLTVVQPTLQRELSASFAQVQWTGTGYLIAVAGLLVFSGRLGDRYGHQRVFGVGMLGFGAASAGIGVAPGIGWVIGLRVAQGVFGALLQPATLGMLRAAFPPDRLRMPIALRMSAIGLAAAMGPVLGGALVSGPGWRAVFFLNVVPALVFGTLALTVRGNTEQAPSAQPGARLGTGSGGTARQPSGRPHAVGGSAQGQPSARPHPVGTGAEEPSPTSHAVSRLNALSAILLALALAGLVHALVTLPADGLSPTASAALLLTLIAGVAFVRHERRTANPLVPPDVVRSPAVTPALGILVAASATLQGTLFVATFLLQDTLGFDPLHMALLGLPLAALVVAAAPGSAVLLRRAGARRTTVVAMTVLAAGVLVLVRAEGSPTLCAGFALLGAGYGTVMVAATHVVVRQAPVESAGVAGGLQQTAMNVGPVLGVAVATTLMGLGHGHALPLLVLAGVAGAGALVGRRLPKRSALAINTGQEGDPARVPARR
ncbi:MFS transporter [Streptomyces sp. CA-249302]|uniref:MFS transporter n=1 Tax=Streptomyces sp. CA-249302 TaxID=3240058 RepID=UPI003D9141B3